MTCSCRSVAWARNLKTPGNDPSCHPLSEVHAKGQGDSACGQRDDGVAHPVPGGEPYLALQQGYDGGVTDGN